MKFLFTGTLMDYVLIIIIVWIAFITLKGLFSLLDNVPTPKQTVSHKPYEQKNTNTPLSMTPIETENQQSTMDYAKIASMRKSHKALKKTIDSYTDVFQHIKKASQKNIKFDKPKQTTNNNIVKTSPIVERTTYRKNEIEDEHDNYGSNDYIGEHDYDSDGEITIDGGYDKYGYPEGENPDDDYRR